MWGPGKSSSVLPSWLRCSPVSKLVPFATSLFSFGWVRKTPTSANTYPIAISFHFFSLFKFFEAGSGLSSQKHHGVLAYSGIFVGVILAKLLSAPLVPPEFEVRDILPNIIISLNKSISSKLFFFIFSAPQRPVNCFEVNYASILTGIFVGVIQAKKQIWIYNSWNLALKEIGFNEAQSVHNIAFPGVYLPVEPSNTTFWHQPTLFNYSWAKIRF